MSKKKAGPDVSANADDGQRTLKKALIAFAITEALVLIPLVLYMMLRRS